MPRGPSRPFPSISVMDAARIADTIRRNNAGRPMNRVLLAQSVRISPASSGFRETISASSRYQFTKGNYNSEAIELTDIGEQLTKPRSEGERLDALRQGFRGIPLFDQLLTHFNNSKLPTADFLKNVLERAPFNVKPEWSDEAAQVFLENGTAVGFIRDVGGSPWVVTEAGPPTADVYDTQSEADLSALAESAVEPDQPPEAPLLPTILPEGTTRSESRQPVAKPQFFVAHGRNKAPMEQLQKILRELGIPYVVAQDEANSGRPISQKVRDLMASCTGGIFIFSADEEFKDASGGSILRPRENVIYELGAASYLYDRRIVIFKEDGVTFPTDFNDLGYIEFEKDNLAAKSMELIRELIGLGAVKLMPGS